MTANTPADYETKLGLLEDTYSILDIEKILTGNEEQVGGFDLICRGNPVKSSTSSSFSSHLGCFNNRNF
jgi:tubulin polyglutamylase TTLL9